jgi:ribosomal protein S18 acetylase RimI-like enzyme
MTIVVERLDGMTDEAAEALTRLLPQLSRSATGIDRAQLTALVEHEANTVLVAKLDGRIVGSLTLVVFPLITGIRAWIEDVVVDHEARGHGVGRELTVEAVRRASAMGARTIDLTSRPAREAAHRLYEGVGFEVRDTSVYRYMGPR